MLEEQRLEARVGRQRMAIPFRAAWSATLQRACRSHGENCQICEAQCDRWVCILSPLKKWWHFWHRLKRHRIPSELTPGHYLVGQPLTAVSEPSVINERESLAPSNSRSTSGAEYLHQLQQRQRQLVCKHKTHYINRILRISTKTVAF